MIVYANFSEEKAMVARDTLNNLTRKVKPGVSKDSPDKQSKKKNELKLRGSKKDFRAVHGIV